MPRDLFGAVTHPSASVGNRKWYTVPVSLLSHVVVVAVLVIAPLMATGVLPSPSDSIGPMPIIEIVPLTPPPPVIRRESPPPLQDAIPFVAPTGINAEPPERMHDPVAELPPGFVSVGDTDLPPPPSVVVAPPPKPQEPVRVGGTIRPPQKIRDVPPVYPQTAMSARIEGLVILEATISAEGRVVDLRVLRSLPLLEKAAVDAVRQWEFTPTLLNGMPVPVIMTVTVNFQLRQ